MREKLIERCELAMQVYTQALAVVAQRGGAEYKLSHSFDEELMGLAGRLAMPADTAGTSQDLPALLSLVGHLLEGSHHGYYAAKVLDIDRDAIMPVLERPNDLAARYQELWLAMQRDLAGLAGNTAADVREASYLGLLQRYAWSMAAPGNADTDVSLFDYTRVQAALAVCLAEKPDESAGVALLIGGDVSGVQEWLYTIGSEGAARSLRGRSVYLQLLSEIIAQWLLDCLELPSCNLLYAGGGNFYILAPLSAADRLDALQIELTQRLLKMHDGALYVALGHTALTRCELERQEVGGAWGRVNAAMSVRKRRRFAELTGVEMAKAIGSPLSGTGKLEDICRICRRPIRLDEKAKKNEEGERVCQTCASFEDLGNQLPRAGFLVVSRLDKTPEATAVLDWRAGLRQFGYDVQFVRHAQESLRGWQSQESTLVRVYYWQQQQPDVIDFPGALDVDTAVWLYRPLAQATPMYGDHVATFDQLETEGIQRWGVLRMDMDKLGAIFQEGVKPASLSRVVGLSGMLRLFFEGYVPKIAHEFNAHGPRIYLMYAGGDDLFVVGGWSHLPELAWKIREALREFAADNDQITISAGISLALSERYPIYQAARDAGEAEEMAKREGRNRITLLGQAVEWGSKSQTGFPAIHQRVQQIAGWLTRNDLNRSFLMRLREIDAEIRVWQKHERAATQARYKHNSNRKLYLGPWLWHMVYSLRRATERVKDGDAKSSVSHFIDTIMPDEIEVLGLESRWAELLTRKKGNEGD